MNFSSISLNNFKNVFNKVNSFHLENSHFSHILNGNNNIFLSQESFDQPYTLLQKAPIDSETFLKRSSAIFVLFILVDIILLVLYLYKRRNEIFTKNNMHASKQPLLKDLTFDSINSRLHES